MKRGTDARWTKPMIGRRDMMVAAAALTTGFGAVRRASGAVAPIRLDLTDPAIALETYVKLRGSTARETVFQAYQGDIFLIEDGTPGIPLVGFAGIQKSHWQPDGAGGYRNADYDIGFYVDYATRAILRSWNNPVTGRTVDAFPYRGGPSGGHWRVGVESGDVYGGVAGRWAVIGDQVTHTASNWGARPNPMMPKEWPLASSGETIFGSMSISFSGRLSDVMNPAIHRAPALQIWTNTTAWMPWMEMGQRPGLNEWRWVGAKGVDRAALDPVLVAACEKVWPGYVSDDRVWQVPTSGRTDYMRLKRGQALTR